MRIDFYTHVHKKQRKFLFELSTKLGEADFTQHAIVNHLHDELLMITNDLRHHAHSEETFVHPLLKKKIPSSEKALYEEHKELKAELLCLENSYQHLQELGVEYFKIQEQGLEFYRLFNRFITHYLLHINEEEYIMQNLWEIALDCEMRGMMIAFQTHDGVEKGQKWLEDNLPALSLSEQKLMFHTVGLLAPEAVFLTMCELSKSILGNEKWEIVMKPQSNFQY